LIGGNGIEKVIELKLNETEKKMMDHSIKAVTELVEALKKL
jgi:malate/lactate dehydrogenase